jgi:acetoacetyl-CoA reductase
MLTGKVALVTGGARGIGRAISERMAEAGADVALGYFTGRAAAEDALASCEQHGTKVSLHQGNIGVPEDCQRVYQEVIDTHGRIDILVNNAGINVDKTMRKMSIDDWHKVLRVNLSGAFYMTKCILEHMLERSSGRIINISSIVGERGNVGQANYAAAKSGLIGFTKTLALETARKGITVNAVAPGFILTDMLKSVPENVLQGIIDDVPMRRLGEPDDVARTVVFLAEDYASYITGQVIGVNGGLYM